MADKKISALTAATTPLAGTEVLPIVQSSTTKKVSVADLTAGRDTSVAKLTATDNIVIATAGKGVDFSAASHAAGMTSELLADYEEGTWTPSDGSGATLSLSNATGRYTRIGRVVTASFSFSYPSTANASDAKINGLPFATPADTAVSSSCLTNNGVVLAFYLDQFSTTFAIKNAATNAALTNANLSTNYVSGTFVYQV